MFCLTLLLLSILSSCDRNVVVCEEFPKPKNCDNVELTFVNKTGKTIEVLNIYGLEKGLCKLEDNEVADPVCFESVVGYPNSPYISGYAVVDGDTLRTMPMFCGTGLETIEEGTYTKFVKIHEFYDGPGLVFDHREE